MGPYSVTDADVYDGIEVPPVPGEVVNPSMGNIPAQSGFNWSEVLSGAADSIVEQLFGNNSSQQSSNNNTNAGGSAKGIPGWVWITLILVLLAVVIYFVVRKQN